MAVRGPARARGFLATAFVVLAGLPFAAAAQDSNRCAEAVQGKIAWDYEGTTRWAEGNVDRLCAWAEDSTEPAQCFERVMHGGVEWGGGTRWQWKNALDLCRGTHDAAATIACFETRVGAGMAWKEAIESCQWGLPSDPDEETTTSCAEAVQGKIAWDYEGTTRWAEGNVERLCSWAEDSTEPARCFERVMHGGVDWGGGTRWQWTNALDLCRGTHDAAATVACFETRLGAGLAWREAIESCQWDLPSGGDEEETTTSCAEAVQGKIAWDYEGTTRWAEGNVERLCSWAEDSAEPARCFERVMHGGVDWGGGTRWQWKNALDLCRGTHDAAATVACFETRVSAGMAWREAIESCQWGLPSE